MWVKFNDATERFFDDEIVDEPIEPSDNGTVQVAESVGEQLINKHDVSEHDSDSVSDSE